MNKDILTSRIRKKAEANIEAQIVKTLEIVNSNPILREQAKRRGYLELPYETHKFVKIYDIINILNIGVLLLQK